MNRVLLIASLSLAVQLAFGSTTNAEDWPHWMGPSRDNVWAESAIIDSFPEEGPKILWRTEIGGGYAGPSVAGGKVFITDYVSAEDVKVANFERKEFSGIERVHCLDEQNGNVLWSHEYPVKYGISYPAGPRCTPVVDDGHVYTLGAEGTLICFKIDDGDVVWERDLVNEYETKAALWGYSAHPLIDGDSIITLAGGEGSHIIALNKETGEEQWRALTAPEQGYAPPTIIEAGGVRQLITLRPDAVSSLNPETGEEYWSVPYEATSGSIIMSPIQFENFLYVAGYSGKSLLLKLDESKPAAEEVWRDKRRSAISPVNVQPILDPKTGILYGMNENGDLRATQLPSGEMLWSTPEPISERPQGSGTAFIVRQADRYWLFNELGELVIAKLTEEGYEEIDRTKVIEPTNLAFGRDVVWSMPAYANRHAYIRNDNEIICVDLAQ